MLWLGAFVVKFLDALIAIPKIADIVKGVIVQVMVWYVQGFSTETLSQIADAAASAARAQTQEDRFRAGEAWQKAFSRPRVSQ